MSFCIHLPPFKHFSAQIPVDYKSSIFSDLAKQIKMLVAQQQMLRVTTRAMSQHASRPSSMVDKFVRVDHAGELGADRIYAGQMAVLGAKELSALLKLVFIVYCF